MRTMSPVDTRPGGSDAKIQRDVIAQLNRDALFTPAELGVEVTNRIVTLTGAVSSREKIGAAMDIAAAIPGVRVVANKLTVQPEPGGPDISGAGVRGDAAMRRSRPTSSRR